MLTRSFSKLPAEMQNRAVRAYYDMLAPKRRSLFFKRVFDVTVSALLAAVLSPLFLLLAALIRRDSKGPVFYRQTRITQNMRPFRIYKFRTMVNDADKKGPLVTTETDGRITKFGQKLRNSRLDELPQIFNVFLGDMTFVGTRPEVPKYVAQYNDEMLATLLLPAGLTSRASVLYKDEARLLKNAADADEIYVGTVLPQKMVYNLEYLRDFRFSGDIKMIFDTFFAVAKKDRPASRGR